RQRPTQMTLKWVKGHDGHERNEGTDVLARAAVDKQKVSYINLEVLHDLYVTGAKLSAMTQALAYRAIRQEKSKENDMHRKKTSINVM
ncbi:hypothetical protein F5876DRAFT_51067, partial [Lentinula aff. lateritia]